MQNHENKKLRNEKKDALAAQFAAEASLSKVFADQKDDDFLSLESVIAPLEAEIKMYKNEVRITKIQPNSHLFFSIVV